MRLVLIELRAGGDAVSYTHLEGLGCAFCMDGALAIRSDPRLRFIPLEPRRMTHSVLVWKKNKLFSPATSLFIQEINMMRARME